MYRNEILPAIKNGFSLEKPWDGRVIIIGAGIAGLTAGHILGKSGIEYTILEASQVIGGRIRALEGFADFPIELGAEEIHGRKSAWYELIQAQQKEVISPIKYGTTFYKIEDKVLSLKEMQNAESYERVDKFTLNWEEYDHEEVSVADYIKRLKVPEQYHHVINAWYGNEYGTSNQRLGVLSMAQADRKWSSGESNFAMKNGCYNEVLKATFADVLPKVQLNSPVVMVDTTKELIEIDTKKGQYTANKVIVTVPLSVLKAGDIAFLPAFDKEKQKAIDTIGMDAGMKIILKFKERFWQEDMVSIFPGGQVPEFWATGIGKDTQDHVLTAFVNGENAEYLSSLGEQAVYVALHELDEFYGERKATDNLVDSYIMDWSKEPYIKGAYSYPALNSEPERISLAEPIDDKIFFAGEATNAWGHLGTVHGALETGYRAVKEVVESIELFE
ncbi:flavin monoamine oxidase family protein [Microscilla marina]|uniref:Tryptophan 2-monooxygenase n=1 Tax=Microscilla marina ATCC 23134 TaxID=313606 RepID=A1ZNB9_MICM2|nr:NAD(P)/FAD-dependent oxidoreductase [Microscilla marina]EAY28030.1 amine oxidase, flavin-containing superfamily [Microscilla marina ATCC 23134]